MKNTDKVASAAYINKPNASKLISSLRHTGYDNFTAIEDLVDNSIDAGANQIWIEISSKGKEVTKISISDDGSGMTSQVLREAIKLGSDTDKDPNSDLGRYGMGLVTASISIAKHLEIFTKNLESEQIYRAVQDLDLIEETNEFVAELGNASETQAQKFSSYLLDLEKKYPVKNDNNKQTEKLVKATQVILSKIDRAAGNKDYLVKGLKREISRSFRRFIDAGLGIYINGEALKADDQIKKCDGKLLIKDVFEVKGEEVKVLIYELKDYGTALNRDKGYSLKNQGFSVLRNGREIMTGQRFDLFKQRPELAFFRGEIEFPAALDNELKTGFTKSSISLSQSLYDKVHKILDPQLKGIKTRYLNRNKSKREPIPLTELEKYIAKQKHLLNIPKGKFNLEGVDTKKEIKITPSKRKKIEDKPDTNIKKNKRITKRILESELNVDVTSTISRGVKGPLFEPTIEGKKITINWNEDHPFYNLVVLETSEQTDIQWPIIFLIYAYATSELNCGTDSDSADIMSNIRYEVGQNLAVLMRD